MAFMIQTFKLKNMGFRRQLLLLLMFLAVSLLSSTDGFSAETADIPPQNSCQKISIRESGGWWISIKQDGSAQYGFGTQPSYIRVPQNTFSFSLVYQMVAQKAVADKGLLQGPYLAVACYLPGESSAVEHRLAYHDLPFADLMNRARNYSLPPEHEVEKISYERIDSFWDKSPPYPDIKIEGGE